MKPVAVRWTRKRSLTPFHLIDEPLPVEKEKKEILLSEEPFVRYRLMGKSATDIIKREVFRRENNLSQVCPIKHFCRHDKRPLDLTK